MYTKIASFPRTKSSLSLLNEKRIHQFLRNLCTAVQRSDFANPNGYQIEDSVNGESHNLTESSKEVSISWNQNPIMSNSQLQTHWHSGITSDDDVRAKIKEFEAFCNHENLKMALTTMEALEKMGYAMDLARLLLLAPLCVEEDMFREVSVLQEAKASVQGKIRALVYGLDANYLKYYTDVMIGEFDSFCKQGKVKNALYSIDIMASMSHVVDLSRLLRLAKLCGEAEALQEAKNVHGKISALVCHLDVSSYHVLIEMYSNCGLVNEAFSVFETMPEKNLETWCSIIRCFANNGLGEDAIDMFTRFKKEGIKPHGQLFRVVFYTCGVLGDVDEGLLHFESMSRDYGIIPSMEDYVSIVEMYALPGFLEEALEFVEKMPMEPNADVWETLMNLSRVHGDLELGDRCAEFVELLDPTRLNKQSKEGFLPVKASDVEKESLKKKSGIHALNGITNRTREYKAGDMNLPENDELYTVLRNLKMHMIEKGYVADTRSALHDIDEESKETALLGHSERIAFARAVLNSPPRTSFMVVKNLRVCVDCHNACKIMADIVGRRVVMRDLKRFHHLENGGCTCNDYW
ncbi:Pentatricopeptide repeat-containing protein [Cardamine amara subsp. amara]|uniref:Pentatricopeptide repeat-containing protein n=1 Tax=Cardamine amara subsp. amara TaxID=228776 RepID=A0ABD1B650_CARAN